MTNNVTYLTKTVLIKNGLSYSGSFKIKGEYQKIGGSSPSFGDDGNSTPGKRKLKL